MKPYFALIILLFNLTSFGQDTTVSYFNSDWKKVSKKKAKYYRHKIKIKSDEWKVNDFYMNNQLQMSGTYTSKKIKDLNQNGAFTYYSENGQKTFEETYSKGKKVGEYKSWNEAKVLIENGYYDQNGNRTGLYKRWYKNGELYGFGEYSENKKTGTWKYYFNNDSLSAIEYYSMGNLDSLKFWNKDGTKVNGHLSVFTSPKFQNGTHDLADYFNLAILNLKKRGVGKVVVQFVIEKNGSVSEVKIAKSINKVLDEEIIKIFLDMPKWQPAKRHNIPLKIRTSQTLNFGF